MKKKIWIIALTILTAGTVYNLSGCSASKSVQAKSGVQLWGENCVRCHNAPSPTRYSDRDWSVILTHMRMTANLTEAEEAKIREYLQSAN
jgi:hypothetical protein